MSISASDFHFERNKFRLVFNHTTWSECYFLDNFQYFFGTFPKTFLDNFQYLFGTFPKTFLEHFQYFFGLISKNFLEHFQYFFGKFPKYFRIISKDISR